MMKRYLAAGLGVFVLAACGASDTEPVGAPLETVADADVSPITTAAAEPELEPERARATQEEIEAATAGFDERVTVAIDRTAAGDVGFWMTAWTERTEEGAEVVCLGDPYGVSCHDDNAEIDFMGDQPVHVMASGFAPVNGVVLLVAPGVSELAATFPGATSSPVTPYDPSVGSGRSVVAFGNPTDSVQVAVEGVRNGVPFSVNLPLASPPPLFPVEGQPDLVVEYAPAPDPSTVAHGPKELAAD